MTLRLYWKSYNDSTHISTVRYTPSPEIINSAMSRPMLSPTPSALPPPTPTSSNMPPHNTMPPPYITRLYLSYNVVTQQTTIITTGLDQFYLCVDQHLRELFKASSRPEEIVPRLLLRWFAMAQECFAGIVEVWDVNTDGTVCSGKPLSSLVPHLADPLFSIGDGITSGGTNSTS